MLLRGELRNFLKILRAPSIKNQDVCFQIYCNISTQYHASYEQFNSQISVLTTNVTYIFSIDYSKQTLERKEKVIFQGNLDVKRKDYHVQLVLYESFLVPLINNPLGMTFPKFKNWKFLIVIMVRVLRISKFYEICLTESRYLLRILVTSWPVCWLRLELWSSIMVVFNVLYPCVLRMSIIYFTYSFRNLLTAPKPIIIRVNFHRFSE